ncbi:hypothetical protein LTR50_000474 [Elasticomyces elasticus]|nr:hypothetical protein LTR50_000474 [Elasticomyces elasticus]
MDSPGVESTRPRKRLRLTVREPNTPSPTSNRPLPRPNQNIPKAITKDLSRPSINTDKEDKRKLRSQGDGGKLKSELAIYFPNYHDIIYDVPKEPEFLTTDKSLLIVDSDASSYPSKPKSAGSNTFNGVSPSHGRSPYPSNGVSSHSRLPVQASAQIFNDAQVLDFSSVLNNLTNSYQPQLQDPLQDVFYLPSHKRAARKEKQLRNIEKERAMHEKVQLERLLDGLQGHDWLRVMGISGITDGEARKYESKRDYFVSEVRSLVEKFRRWKDEEKRLRAEKAAREAEEEDEDEVGEEADMEDHEEENAVAGVEEPQSDDMDRSAALQLQRETSSTIVNHPSQSNGRSKQRLAINYHTNPLSDPPFPYQPPLPERPFTSFFAKPHLRTLALGKQSTRHSSLRNVTAFGLPIPEMEQADFVLPKDYVTRETLRDNARKRRRIKRESLADSSQ